MIGRVQQRPFIQAAVTFLLLALLALGLPPSARQADAQTTTTTPGTAPGTATGDTAQAFTGLASSPGPLAFTGAASTSISIDVPPGRLAMTPSVELRYSVSRGDSPYGFGWDLTLPRVERSRRDGVPRYDDSDRFELNLGNRSLELERDPSRPGGFRPRIQGSFPRIGFDEANNTWIAIEASGLKMTFGRNANSRIAAQGAANEPDSTFSWLITAMEDPAGNTIEFEYEDVNSGAGLGLPRSIRYGGNTAVGLPHFQRVDFVWRPINSGVPARVHYSSGLPQFLNRRLESIQTFAHDDLVRRYQFAIRSDVEHGPEQLAEVSLTAHSTSGGDDVEPPPTVFRYTPWTSEGWPTAKDGDVNAQGIVFRAPPPGPFREDGRHVDYDTFDLDGDSIVDYVHPITDPPAYRRGTGRGFEEARPWNWPGPRKIRATDGDGNMWSNVMDIDGDGLPDLIDARRGECGDPQAWCVWRNTGDGFADTASTWWAPADEMRHSHDAGTKIYIDLVDLNGDGLADYVDALPYDSDDSFPHWNVYWNTGSGFERNPQAFGANRSYIARLTSDRTAYGLYDMNGDGLRDMVAADGGSIDSTSDWYRRQAWFVYFNNGSGFQTEPYWWQAQDGTPLPNFSALDNDSGQGRTADLVDLNGDGLPDLVRRTLTTDQWGLGFPAHCSNASRCTNLSTYDTAADGPWCCYNLMVFYNTGSSFTAPQPWHSMNNAIRGFYTQCPSSRVSCGERPVWSYDLFDFDGDGLVDLLQRDGANWRVFPNPASPSAQSSSIPVGERGPPSTLIAMMNGVGASTTLAWTSIAEQQTTHLAFPRWTLQQLRLWDGVHSEAVASTTYEYRDGFFDPIEREFRGFGNVREIEASGLHRETQFHQDQRRAGLVERVRVIAPDGSVVGEDEYQWATEGPVLLESHLRTPWHQGQPVQSLELRRTYDYDQFGNTTSVLLETPLAASSLVESSYDAQITDDARGLPWRYRTNRPSSVTIFEVGRTTPLREQRFDYQDRNGHAEAVISATCQTWSGSNCEKWSLSEVRHNRVGNIASSSSPNRLNVEYFYDQGAIAPIEIDHAVLGTTAFTYDRGTGQTTSTTNEAGLTSHSQYDGLGRLVRSWGAAESPEFPRTQHRWVEGDGDGKPGRIETYERGKAPLVLFYDSLGRSSAAKTFRETETGQVTVISGIKEYDADGQIYRQASSQIARDAVLTMLATQTQDIEGWTHFERDQLGRLTATTLPDGSRTEFDRSMPGVTVRIDPTLVSGDGPGAATIHIFDGMDRPIHRELCDQRPPPDSPHRCPEGALRAQTMWFYDAMDRPVEIRSIDVEQGAREAIVQLEYDGLGNRTQVTDVNGGVWRYKYDSSGQLTQTLRPDGVSIEQSWDLAGRLIDQRTEQARSSFRYRDSGSGHGKVQRITSRSGNAKIQKRFEYDDLGRRTAESRKIRIPRQKAQKFEFSFQYDDLDRVTAVSYPTTTTSSGELMVTTDYSPFGMPRALASPERSYVEKVTHSAAGALTSIHYGNGLQDSYAHHHRGAEPSADGSLTCMRTALVGASGDACAVTASTFHALHYADYDDNGRLRVLEDLINTEASASSAAATYSYDALSRLTAAEYGDGNAESFSYDGLGNILTLGDSALQYSNPAHPHQLTQLDNATESRSEPIEYDLAGNLSRKGEWRYQFDGLNRLTAIYKGQELIERRFYDEGSTVVGTEEGPTGDGRILFAPWFELNGSIMTRSYFLGRRKVAEDHGSVPPKLRTRRGDSSDSSASVLTLFLHTDHQGSALLVTDQQQNVVARPRYRAYGQTRSTSTPASITTPEDGFTGHPQSASTGLINMTARAYDPELASFLTPDPAAQYSSPYRFSAGNPILGRDPDGQVFGLTALQMVALVSAATSIADHLEAGGNFAGALTAGVTAGLTTVASANLSQAFLKSSLAGLPSWAQAGTAIVSVGMPARSIARGIANGEVSATILSVTSLAASVMGAEQASVPDPSRVQEGDYAAQGIAVVDTANKRTIFSSGICATKPGCVTNFLTALRENARLLFTGSASCVNGCETIVELTREGMELGKAVHLQCNSFGATKCLGAVQTLLPNPKSEAGLPQPFSATMTGAPILRAPQRSAVNYQVNLFDPVVWAGPLYMTPFRADVSLGRSWWVPLPLLTHHPSFYQNSQLRKLYASRSTP